MGWIPHLCNLSLFYCLFLVSEINYKIRWDFFSPSLIWLFPQYPLSYRPIQVHCISFSNGQRVIFRRVRFVCCLGHEFAKVLALWLRQVWGGIIYHREWKDFTINISILDDSIYCLGQMGRLNQYKIFPINKSIVLSHLNRLYCLL